MSPNILQMRQRNIEAVATIYKKGKVAKNCMIDRVNGLFYSRNESQFVCLNLWILQEIQSLLQEQCSLISSEDTAWRKAVQLQFCLMIDSKSSNFNFSLSSKTH